MDLERIESLLKLLKDEDIAEFEYSEGSETDGWSVRVNRGAVVTSAPIVAAAPAASSPAPAVSAVAAAAPDEVEEEGLNEVQSPMVGTFYRAPSPDAGPFVQVGDQVTRGQTLCIVEAMKLMNEIEADVDGTVASILVDDAQPVQFGQALFKIRVG
ncbi:MAG: acetyl-CoA carboxylase biotin carboxyl carrier protein [Myxococcota bacterium]|nr:acetyl-CoA carboxylase biotin carboxyl carrier protein [Myxococcota bacterium]